MIFWRRIIMPFGILAILFPTLASAATCYNLIVSFGTISGCVSLSAYLQGVVTTTIGIAGILAVFMIIFCGIKLMTSGSVSGKSAAKECIWSALFGLLLAVGSWVILNTLNPLLLSSELGPLTQGSSAGGDTPYVATTQPVPTIPGWYYKYKVLVTGDIRYLRLDTGGQCEEIRAGVQAQNTNYEILSKCFEVKGDSTSTTITTSTPPPTTTVTGSATCNQTGLNLCEGKYRECKNPKCASFNSMISAQASHTGLSGSDGVNILKSMLMQESSCGIQLSGDGGEACGPIHIQPETANKFRTACGVPAKDIISCGWLSAPANWEKAICLSAEFIKSLKAPCGTSIRSLAAGYNGGAGACANSSNCGTDTSCAGGSVKRWECLYDDNAHKICNVGYVVTRNYATNVLYCSQHPF